MNILLPDKNQLLRIFQKAVNKLHLISNGTCVFLCYCFTSEMPFGFVCYD